MAPPLPPPVQMPTPISTNNNNQQYYQPHYTSTQQSNNFWENYEHLCALQNLMPLQSLKQSLVTDAGSNLTLNADKLKSADWEPLFSTLRVNKSLKTIKFYSNYELTDPTAASNSSSSAAAKAYAKLKKPPAIRNKEKTNKLCRSLKDSLSISHHLNKLEIYNVTLSVKDCAQIAKGLRVNKSLKILSLDRCEIGDEGLAVICKDIQGSSNLNRVNFSACGLTHEGAKILATLIKVQALKRHNEAWKDSLRYGRPDLDSMFGIRRITINSNELIGDIGAEALHDAFKSDLWLKALDLQNCGITTNGANFLLDGLKFNAMMHVLDVRLNPDIDRDTLQKIMEQVMINSSGNNTDYEWMDLTQTVNSVCPPIKDKVLLNNNNNNNNNTNAHTISKKLKKRRTTNASFSKKTQFLTQNSSFNRIKRCKSTGSVINQKSPRARSGGMSSGADKNDAQHQGQEYNNNNSSVSGGIPWRTAARANRYRVSSSCAYRKVAADNNGDPVAEDNEDDFDIEEEEEEEDGQGEGQGENNENDYYQPPRQHSNHYSNARASNVINQINQKKLASSTFDYEKFASSKILAVSSNNINTNNNNNNNKSNKGRNSSIESNLKSRQDFVSNLDKIKNVSVKDLLVILQREQESKTQLEDMLIQLKEENTKQKAQISMLRSKLEQSQSSSSSHHHRHHKSSSSNNNNNNTTNQTLNQTVLDDDKLKIIEKTLQSYQAFIDFLRDSDFGKLVDIFEMNQVSMSESPNQTALYEQQQQQYQRQKLYEAQLKKQQQQQQQQLRQQTDQQKYYTNKINKAKSKLTTKNETSLDALVNNALDISRRLNQSSSQQTTTTTKKRQQVNNKDLSNIKEQSNNASLMSSNDNEELESKTKTLLDEYKSLKSQTTMPPPPPAQPRKKSSNDLSEFFSDEEDYGGNEEEAEEKDEDYKFDNLREISDLKPVISIHTAAAASLDNTENNTENGKKNNSGSRDNYDNDYDDEEEGEEEEEVEDYNENNF
jgi:hypothetical protein